MRKTERHVKETDTTQWCRELSIALRDCMAMHGEGGWARTDDKIHKMHRGKVAV